MSIRKNIFIGSSTQALTYAEKLKNILSKKQPSEFEVKIWKDNVFSLNKTFIESLYEAASKKSDFAIFIFAPDDILKIEEEYYYIPRSNVIFEYGLFTGTLNRDKVFALSPSDVDNYRIPTDLLGVKTARYKSKSDNEDEINKEFNSICDEILLAIKEVKTSDNNTIIGHYTGPREYYEVANKYLLSKDLSEIILAQKTSSLLNGYQKGSKDEKMFIYLILEHIKNNTEFIHFTNYLKGEDKCNSYIPYKVNVIKKELGGLSKRPIKKYIGESFPAPILIVVPKDIHEPLEGVLLSHAGISNMCLHIRGNMLKSCRDSYRHFYFNECEEIIY